MNVLTRFYVPCLEQRFSILRIISNNWFFVSRVLLVETYECDRSKVFFSKFVYSYLPKILDKSDIVTVINLN